jgi:DNA adenine methylase
MQLYTPLRYPGGKRRLASTVMRLLEENDLRDVQYVEPYAGGAAVGLALLFEEYASTIHINDLSRPVYAFWHSVLNDTDKLCRRIDRASVTMRQWHAQRTVYDRRENADLLDLGFAAFFLNRANRSGIIGGGVIGGKQQTGSWSLDARFNKSELIHRIRRIARYKNRIVLYQLDGPKFIDNLLPQLGPNTFVFFDPPYIENGKGLYLNEYTLADHRKLAQTVETLEWPWIVTYDYAAVREKLYKPYRRILYYLHYSAQDRYESREALFLSPRLNVPRAWLSSRKVQMARPHSKYPLYGWLEQPKRQARNAPKRSSTQRH